MFDKLINCKTLTHLMIKSQARHCIKVVMCLYKIKVIFFLFCCPIIFLIFKTGSIEAFKFSSP